MTRPAAVLFRRLLQAIAVAAALAPWPAAADMPPLDTLLRQYVEVAFRNEFGGAHRFDRIVKWEGPIRARLEGPHADAYKAQVERQFAILTRLTGLSIEVVDGFRPFADVNMTITFIDTGGRGPENPERACFSSAQEDDNFVLRKAEIMITADIPELRQHCIVEEISQALGLLNDSTLIFPSIFHDDSRQQALSPWDELMFYAHYDPRIKPGMTINQAMPIIREIFVQELAKQNSSGTSSTTGRAAPKATPPRAVPAAPAKPHNPAALN
ncbi:MAG: DUF2927 domain-containing protein [Candidatus Eiseniibacteriota bacterium]